MARAWTAGIELAVLLDGRVHWSQFFAADTNALAETAEFEASGRGRSSAGPAPRSDRTIAPFRCSLCRHEAEGPVVTFRDVHPLDCGYAPRHCVEAPMPIPQHGDILIRPTVAGGFELVDAVSHAFIGGPFDVALTAIAAARLAQPRAIWQQQFDARGRPIGDPVRLPDRPGI